ncbi:branched-chain amino acid transport system substrate-binding protein [Hydrogenophaga palleronii]|uniref:Branched-chain amino acid transport system substrate-binding protein n=1 Tax=Hydrogenophaga palleronii TaxID=65655 RepID=A0ABU1WKE3_9BURK|nr:ABC transporter substrate-binding protein [Hydrogenophaga palleronii]MDR7149758.1 branched-chain amino acid transport system substrate-binding protein [Hydrogenophaga palleronii]
MKHRRLTTLVFAVLAATPLAGHAQAGDDKGPIVVGAVSSLTGAGASDASTQAAQLVFNAVNAAGGIQGRPIAYRVIDDQMNPVKAQEAAQALVNDPRVVALAGGSSVLECAVNHARYAQAGLFSLPGAGVDPVCFSATHIAPLNAGPYASTANALTFASKVLRHQTICVVSPALPGMTEAFKKTVLEWAQRASVTAPTLDVYQLDDPLPPLVQRVAARGCQVVVYTGPGGPAVGWVLASRPFMPKVPVVMLTSAYTSQAAKALEAVGQGIYAMAEFDPWSSGTLQIMNWRRLLIARQVEPSSLSQGGHIAAQALVHTLQGIKGPIHRANVAKALETMAPWRSGMTHQAFRVGAQGKHELNRSALPMRLDGDRWRIAHPEWISN